MNSNEGGASAMRYASDQQRSSYLRKNMTNENEIVTMAEHQPRYASDQQRSILP
jgi:hypothetical protein